MDVFQSRGSPVHMFESTIQIFNCVYKCMLSSAFKRSTTMDKYTDDCVRSDYASLAIHHIEGQCRYGYLGKIKWVDCIMLVRGFIHYGNE